MKELDVLRRMILVTITILLSGCAATVPVMSDNFDAQAERFSPGQGKANIYVVRDSGFAGSAVLFQVLLNGRVEGAIAPGTYFLFEVPPGSHSIAVITQENADSEKIQAREGKNYFIEIKPVVGLTAARVSLESIGEERGRQVVIDGKRAESLMAE
jgi:hypothetical protein